VIRRLDAATKNRLRMRAARHGRSMEEEARAILKAELARPEHSGEPLGDRIHAIFAAIGGWEMPEISRDPMREPPTFE
jgi:antitoxin FitA